MCHISCSNGADPSPVGASIPPVHKAQNEAETSFVPKWGCCPILGSCGFLCANEVVAKNEENTSFLHTKQVVACFVVPRCA